MRKYSETLFDIFYLLFILISGGLLLTGGEFGVLFGGMALVLGIGDLFHLLPRCLALWDGKPHTKAIGFGKWITSITSAIYYILLHQVCLLLNAAILFSNTLLSILLLARIILCCLPQNQWFISDPPQTWSVIRNIPFWMIGAILVIETAFLAVPAFRFLSVAITLSFLFYTAVVLWGKKRTVLGMLMIPKTCMYIWIHVMGIQFILR